MDDHNTQFEETSMENVWIKTHILDRLDRITQYELIATTGDHSNFNEGDQEKVMRIKERLSALEGMEAELNILFDNVSSNIKKKSNYLRVYLRLKTPEKFIQDEKIYDFKEDQRDHSQNFFLARGFYLSLENLKKAKFLLIQCCAEAGYFLHVKDEEIKGKKTEVDPEEVE